MITLLKKIAIRPMDDALNIVKLTNIMEGVDGAAVFGYNLEPVAIQVEDNQTQQYKHIHTFDVRVIEESADSAIIDGWIAEQTRVEIMGQGIDGLFFMSDVLLTRNKQYDGIFASAFFATVETLTSFTRGQDVFLGTNTPEKTTSKSLRQQVYAGTSLIDRYDTRLSSFYTDGDTYQNGWVRRFGISSNVNVADGVVTFSTTDTSDRYQLSESWFMPFSDQPLRATINVTNVNQNLASGPYFGIIYRYFNGTSNVAKGEGKPIAQAGSYSVIFKGDDFANEDITSNLRGVQLFVQTDEADQFIQYDSVTFDVVQSTPSTTPAGQITIDITGPND